MSKKSARVKFHSPLRYPGGKGKVANFIKLLMLKNGIVGYDYVEPYAGGASVALALLFSEFAARIHINDLNPGVHAFWHSVLNDTESFCELITNTPVTPEEWYKQRETYLKGQEASLLELGFATFFLNRTNRSGIIATAGMIGGKNQTGRWKIDARYHADDLVRRVRKIGRYKPRVSLSRTNAADYLREYVPRLGSQRLVYLDPPYYVKGGGLYENSYQHADHAEIAGIVDELAGPWMVSYDAAPEISDLFRPRDPIRYGLAYSAAKSSEGEELLYLSDDLAAPAEFLPAGVRMPDVKRAMTHGVA